MDEDLFIDKTELVFRDMSSGREVMRNISYSNITSILVGTKIIKKFFGLKKVVSEAIQIKVVGLTDSLEIVKVTSDNYEKYLEGLKKFAHDNHVSMRFNSPDEKPFNAKPEWDGKK